VAVDRAADQRLVAQIFGVAHLSMLGGFVFFSHQIGSFMGVWLGGVLYDRTGSYDIVWYISIALGVFAALVNLPVFGAALAALAAVFALYTRPGFLVTLADQLWACF
jgi:hypothetical protein